MFCYIKTLILYWNAIVLAIHSQLLINSSMQSQHIRPAFLLKVLKAVHLLQVLRGMSREQRTHIFLPSVNAKKSGQFLYELEAGNKTSQSP